MALANLPVALDPAASPDLATAVLWAASVLGVVGLVAVVALFRRVPWAGPLLLAVAALNIAGGIYALAVGDGAGVVGLVLGLAAAALTLVPARGSRR